MTEVHQHTGSLNRFCRQYLQLERELDYPSPTLLREEHTQSELHQRLFSDGAITYPPPPGYKLRVLKGLMKRIEASIDDWDQHVCNKHNLRNTDSHAPRDSP